jgi:hypothetical protein
MGYEHFQVKAGVQKSRVLRRIESCVPLDWIPASAGMTG